MRMLGLGMGADMHAQCGQISDADSEKPSVPPRAPRCARESWILNPSGPPDAWRGPWRQRTPNRVTREKLETGPILLSTQATQSEGVGMDAITNAHEAYRAARELL